MKTAFEHNKSLIQNCKPSMAYDPANSGWRSAAREKLAALLGMDKFQKVAPQLQLESKEKIPGATKIYFSFQSEEGYRVPCALVLPEGIQKPPVMICLQGHTTGMHISLGVAKYAEDPEMIAGERDFCLRAVKEGFAAVAMEQRNFGECGGDENGPQCLESSMIALLMGRTTIGERVWDMMRLIDVLESELADVVDTNCICCTGNSGGGTAVTYTAALEDRIALAMPGCAMCNFKDSIGAMHHCSCNYVPNIARYFDMGDIMAMAAPKYFVQVSGREDDIFPIAGAEEAFDAGAAAYTAEGCGDRCVLIEGDGGHRFYAGQAWEMVHKFLGR